MNAARLHGGGHLPSLCMPPWLTLDSGPCAPNWNMAFDEALMEQAPATAAPVLRFYGWTERAATFGYFQRFADVEQLTLLRPLIRRPTGGGLVPHDADWTYCLAFPAGHEWHGVKAEESYRRVHDWLRLAFARLGVATELAPCCRPGEGQCFRGYEQHDLLWQGRKIAGAAQRRTKTGLLIQGSVQPPPLALKRGDWQQAMLAVAETEWHVRWKALPGFPADSETATDGAGEGQTQPAQGFEAGAASRIQASQRDAGSTLGRVGVSSSAAVPESVGKRLRARAAELAAAKYSQDDFNRKR
jgi:hypothetical protein